MSRYTPMPPQNFGGLPEEYSKYETARAVIFPVPLERTATYERGTRNGPSAILEASRHMELYDEELELDPSQHIGIATWPPIDTMDGTFEEVLSELYTAQLELLDAGKFPVALGGEHSLTPPLVSATVKKFKDLCVLHIGAHAEMRNEFQGNPGSHVCTMRRVVEMCPAVQVGVRSLSEEESKILPKLPTKVYWSKDIVRAPVKAWIAKVLEDLGAARVPHRERGRLRFFDCVRHRRAGTGRARLVSGDFADTRRGGPQKNRGDGCGRTFAAPARPRLGFSRRQTYLQDFRVYFLSGVISEDGLI